MNPASLKLYFPVLFGLLVFILVISGITFLFESQKERTQQETTHQLQAVTELKTRELHFWRQNQFAVLSELVNGPLVRRIDIALKGDEKGRSALLEIKQRLSNLLHSRDYSGILLLDNKGNVILNLESRQDLLDHFLKFKHLHLAQLNKNSLTNVYTTPGGQDHLVLQGQLIYQQFHIGNLVIFIDPESQLTSRLQHWPKIEPKGETVLHQLENDSFSIIASSDSGIDGLMTYRQALSTKPEFIDALKQQKGALEFLDRKGQSVIGYLQKIPDSPWFLISKINKQALFAPFLKRYMVVVTLISIVVLLLSLVLFYWWRVQHQKQQLKHEQLNKHYLNTVQTIIVALDAQGYITMINRSGYELLGAEQDELIGKQWFEHCLPQPSGMQEVYPVFLQIMAGDIQNVEYFENNILTRQGEQRLIAWHNAYFTDDQGDVIGTLSSGQDITEQRATEKLVRINELKYRSIFNATNEAIFIHDGETGRVVDLNESALKMYQLNSEDIKDLSVEKISSGKSPYSKVEVSEKIDRTLREGPQIFAWQGRRLRDGSLFACELSLNKVKIGESPRVIAVVRDISERDALQAERDKLAEQNRLILESSPEGIFGLDQHGQHTFINPAAAEMLGYSVTELTGLSSHQTWHHHHVDGKEYIESECPIFDTIKHGITHSGDEWFIRKDETFLPVYFSSSPIMKSGEIRGAVVSFRDISEEKKTRQQLRLAAAVFEHSTEGVMITDPNVHLIATNKAFTTITGYDSQEVLGKNPRFLKSEHHDRDFYQQLWNELLITGAWKGEIWNRRKDNEVYPQLLSISTIKNRKGKVINYLGVLTDITSIKKVEEKLDFLAHHDPLTGLPNRLLFHELLEHAILQSTRENKQFALLFLDLDQFKHINDNLGHPMGDRVLVEVSRRMRSLLRENDTLCRLGGDEFLLLLENISSPEEVASTAERLNKVISEPFIIKGNTLYSGISIGITIFPEDGTNQAELQKNADTAMYQVKEEGRNSYRFYSRTLADIARERHTLEVHFRQALESDQLSLHYQPQVNIKTGETIGYEALARWLSPNLGNISPLRFIPLAEETGLIVTLGHWALMKACHQMRLWINQGKSLDYIAVNVSAVQLSRGDLINSVREALMDSGIKPGQLELEITESFVMSNPEQAINTLLELKSIGVRMAIDDFGTGYSSLAYLKRLPVNRLKIDQGFVRDMLSDKNDEAIVSSIIALADSMELDVLAEGVESLDQAKRLEEMGCSKAQGWYYGKPMAV